VTAPSVSVVRDPSAQYPVAPPFDPSSLYPELGRLPGGPPPIASERNAVYALVRSGLLAAGFDRQHAGTPDWNPLGTLVPRIGLVVIKPNLVLESTPRRQFDGSIVTHASVVRPLIDYIRLAGGRDVQILVGDVPLQGADFGQLVMENGLAELIRKLNERGDSNLVLADLRRERALVDAAGFIKRIEGLAGDPRGYQEVDVGGASLLEGLPAEQFEGFAVSDYQARSTQRAHAPGVHRYLVPASVLAADLFINVPKLKTHQKAGLTVAIKNLVGVNGDKARVPHYRLGGPSASGDEYPPGAAILRALQARTARLLQGRSRVLYRAVRHFWRATRHLVLPRHSMESAAGAVTLVSGGAWHGNDTLWRSLHDLNLLLRFADRDGVIRNVAQRSYLCIVDGIIAGEGDGPLLPVARHEGVILVGDDALAIDLVAARYMGLDWRRIPQLAGALEARPAWTTVHEPLEDGGVTVIANTTPWHSPRPFRPAPGWLGHIELPDRPR